MDAISGRVLLDSLSVCFVGGVAGLAIGWTVRRLAAWAWRR